MHGFILVSMEPIQRQLWTLSVQLFDQIDIMIAISATICFNGVDFAFRRWKYSTEGILSYLC
jgi:hypothetical protein